MYYIYIYSYVLIHVGTWKNEISKESDYTITPISRNPTGGGRGLLLVFLTRESAALVQSQGPLLFIIKSCDSSLVTIYSIKKNILLPHGSFIDTAQQVGQKFSFLNEKNATRTRVAERIVDLPTALPPYTPAFRRDYDNFTLVIVEHRKLIFFVFQVLRYS